MYPLLYSRSWEGDTHLEDTHAESIAQNLVGFIVVAVPNVCGCYKKLKGVILLDVQGPTLYFLLQLPHSLLPVTVIPPSQERQLTGAVTLRPAELVGTQKGASVTVAVSFTLRARRGGALGCAG